MRQFISDYGLQILATIAAFLLSIQIYVLYVSLLVGADLVTGVMKAYKTRGKSLGFFDVIESRKLFSTVAKWTIYMVALMVGQGASQVFASEEIVKVVLVALSVIEIKSIDENIKAILGYSILSKIIKFFSRSK